MINQPVAYNCSPTHFIGPTPTKYMQDRWLDQKGFTQIAYRSKCFLNLIIINISWRACRKWLEQFSPTIHFACLWLNGYSHLQYLINVWSTQSNHLPCINVVVVGLRGGLDCYCNQTSWKIISQQKLYNRLVMV